MPVNGFSMEIHFLCGSNSLALSGSRENVSLLSKSVNLYVTKSLPSWLWENYFKVENFHIFNKIELKFLSQLSNNLQCSSKIQFCYCIFLF